MRQLQRSVQAQAEAGVAVAVAPGLVQESERAAYWPPSPRRVRGA